jgi:hypothetical protein
MITPGIYHLKTQGEKGWIINIELTTIRPSKMTQKRIIIIIITMKIIYKTSKRR